MCKAYPEAATLYVRTLVSEAKRSGNPQVRRAMLAILRELYNDTFGRDPVGDRAFRKWVQAALQPFRGDQFRRADPVSDVSMDDAFDAEDEVIT